MIYDDEDANEDANDGEDANEDGWHGGHGGHGGSGTWGDRGHGSGPLGDIGENEQVTPTFRRSLLEQWSRPRDGRESVDVTDEIQTLSPDEVERLNRFLGPGQRAHADNLVEQETASLRTRPVSRPVARPSDARVAVVRPPDRQWRYPDTPPRAAPAVVPPAPLDIARLALRSWHVMTQADMLPSHVLARLDMRERRLWLAPILVPDLAATGPDGYGTRLDRLAMAIEARPVTRYLVAALWAVTQSQMPALSPWPPGGGTPARLGVLFAPATGLTRHGWHRNWHRNWHGDWYTRVLRQTHRLLAPHSLLDSLTAIYLHLDTSRCGVPPLADGARWRAVAANARNVLPGLCAGRRTAGECAGAAWGHYVRWLARMVRVPECAIVDRLDDDRRTVMRRPRELCAWTDALLADEPELAHLRMAQVRGRWEPPAVALWLAEPV